MSSADQNQMKQKPNRQIAAGERQRIIEKKKRKRRNRRRFRIFLLIFLTLAVIAGAVLSFRALFKVTGYRVEGNTKYSDIQVFEDSGLKLQKNLFFSDVNSAEKILVSKLPYIDSVEIKRGLPGTLIFNVTETKAICAYQSGTGILYLDKNGKVLELKAGAKTDKLPLLKSPNPVSTITGNIIEFPKTINVKVADPVTTKVENKEIAVNILQIYKDIISAIAGSKIKDISVIDINNPTDVSLVYQNRINLKIGTPSQLESRLSLAVKVIEKENDISANQKGEIDLTILKRAYFKPAQAN